MFLRILKKDLMRKKTMNIIIVLFVILASIFVGSGLNNVITVVNGTDYFFDKAGLGDYIAIRKDNDGSSQSFNDIIPNIKEIKSYRCEECLYASKGNVSSDEKKLTIDNTILLQSLR